MKHLHHLVGASGWYRVDDTNAHTVTHYGLTVREDTVISAWTAKGGAIDLVDWFNISGKTLTTADPALIIPDAWVNEGAQSITLTSGSVNLLRA